MAINKNRKFLHTNHTTTQDNDQSISRQRLCHPIRTMIFQLIWLKCFDDSTIVDTLLESHLSNFTDIEKRLALVQNFKDWGNKSNYVIMFGKMEDGKPICVKIRNFKQEIYFEVVREHDFKVYFDSMKDYFRGHKLSYDLVKRKKMYGAYINEEGHQLFTYARVQVQSRHVLFNTKKHGTKVDRFPRPSFGRFGNDANDYGDDDIFHKKNVSIKPEEMFVTQETRFMNHHGINYFDVIECDFTPSGRLSYSKNEGYARGGMKVIKDNQGIHPLTIASVDIECYSQSGGFPNAERDPIFIIGISLQEFGGSGEIQRFALVLNFKVCECMDKECHDGPRCHLICDGHGCCGDGGGYGKLDDCEIIAFDSERELLMAFRRFVIEKEVDILTGYNILDFDYKYMIKRAEVLNVHLFRIMSRIPGFDEFGFNKDNKQLSLFGRSSIDVMDYIKKNYKLDMYKLDFVSKHFLTDKKGKIDLSPHQIFDYYREGVERRTEVVEYCARDCDLPLKLIDKLDIIPNLVEMSRVTHTSVDDILNRGQQVRVLNQIVHEARVHDYVLNEVPPVVKNGGKYEGATVLVPTTGFYNDPIATLDFASLYPSIVRCHNLCYSTIVTDDSAVHPSVSVAEHDMGGGKVYKFVSDKRYPGVLPQILTNLLTARKHVKKDMKTEKDPRKHALLNGRQLALKVSANSVYGFTGAVEFGKYTCLPIAETITFNGRLMIEKSKKISEEKYGLDVIYGDTDSIFINFSKVCQSIAGESDERKLGIVMEKAEEIAAYITSQFGDNVLLEFEKVYYPFLIMKKKKYVGLKYESLDEDPKIDSKGIEIVRRDNSPFSRHVMVDMVDHLIKKNDPMSAVRSILFNLERLCCGDVDMKDLIVTKSLRSGYKNPENLPHVVVTLKMDERNPGSAPRPGSRVPYVIIYNRSQPKMSHRAEDPEYAEANSLMPDFKYYAEVQVIEPARRLLEHVMTPESFSSFDRILKKIEKVCERETNRSSNLNGWMTGTTEKHIIKKRSLDEIISSDLSKVQLGKKSKKEKKMNKKTGVKCKKSMTSLSQFLVKE